MPRHPNGPPPAIHTEDDPAGHEPTAGLPAIPDPDNPVIELTEDECWDLLIGTMLGRLAVSVADKPELYPVNFLAHDRRILIRTTQGTKLVSMAINNKVALEADGRSLHSVWSVVVKGTVHELTTEAQITTAEQLSLRPWTASVKTTYVEITPSQIRGRRIALADEFKLER
jgi:nitroimidazol reductase NimA-like FMN-containing flavoprotein (pyridoxamine 5'-phosphate oxidase superfamily)